MNSRKSKSVLFVMKWIWIGVKGAYKSRRRMLKEEGTGQIYGLVHGQTRRSARIWALEEKARQLSLQRRTHKPPPSPSALESNQKKRRGRKRKSLLLYMGVNSVAPPMNQKVCLPPFFAFTFKKNILLTNLSVLYIKKQKKQNYLPMIKLMWWYLIGLGSLIVSPI